MNESHMAGFADRQQHQTHFKVSLIAQRGGD